MAVVDGLALQAERVPFDTAVPWDGMESKWEMISLYQTPTPTLSSLGKAESLPTRNSPD